MPCSLGLRRRLVSSQVFMQIIADACAYTTQGRNFRCQRCSEFTTLTPRLISGLCSSPRGLPSGRRPAVSDWASFRPRLAATPLPFSLPSALRKPGNRTFTDQVTRHARRTRSANRRAPALWRASVCGAMLCRTSCTTRCMSIDVLA